MQKRDVPYLVFGILITTVASCRSAIDNNDLTTLEPEWVETSTVAVSGVGGETPADPAAEASAEPPLPSPLPTTDDWQPLGSDRSGLAVSIPPTWVNLTDQINIPSMGNRLGINLVFAADSERTGRSLLAGKSFGSGAYVSGLIVAAPAPTADPATALVDLLTTAAPSAVRLTPITPVLSANGVSGFSVDVGDGPIGLNVSEPDDLRTRVVLYTPPAVNGASTPSWIALLLSASAGRWDQNVELFDRMLQSVRVFDVRPGVTTQEGNVVVRGELSGDRDLVSATLERGVNDLWTFTSAGNRYTSLFLRPEEPQLDLTLTLLGPDRRTIARVDNGYAGVTESTTDLLLTQPGIYIVEVSDFFHDAGRYTLSLVLSDQPQYSGGGPIAFGQALQGELPANGQHYWVFPGAARQRVSIVVEPGAQTFDAILELYGPDGRQLVALDEGFSGDPEVISSFELPSAGEYAILVRSFSPQGGPYTVSLDEGGRQIANFYDAGDLTYGVVLQESLQRQEAHAWFLQGKAGDHILVRVTPISGNLDPDVWLLDGNVERIAAVDAFAAGEPETIELTLNADGQYIVLVRDFNGEPGDYEVALGAAPAATPENAGALSYGDTVIGVVGPGTSVAWDFNAQVGDVIDIDVQPTDSSSDIVLQLQGPDGLTALEVDGNSAGGGESIRAFIVPAAGQWRLVLREFFGDMANYQLSVGRTQ
jgi:hypothetical protein